METARLIGSKVI